MLAISSAEISPRMRSRKLSRDALVLRIPTDFSGRQPCHLSADPGVLQRLFQTGGVFEGVDLDRHPAALLRFDGKGLGGVVAAGADDQCDRDRGKSDSGAKRQ